MYGTADRPIHQVQVEKNQAVITQSVCSRSHMFLSAKDNKAVNLWYKGHQERKVPLKVLIKIWEL